MSIPSTQSLVRGGIRVTGNFQYKIEPEACIKVNIMTESKPGDEVPHDLCTVRPEDGTRIKPWVNVTYCIDRCVRLMAQQLCRPLCLLPDQKL